MGAGRADRVPADAVGAVGVGGRLAGAVLLGEAPLTAHDMPREHAGIVRGAGSRRISSGGRPSRRRQGTLREASRPGSAANASNRRSRRRSTSPRHRDTLAHAIAWSQGPYGVTRDAREEATWAESSRARSCQRTAATPYLYAFLASRYRLQFERADEDRALLERLAKKYKTMLDRVRNAGDPLFVAARRRPGRPGEPVARRHPPPATVPARHVMRER